MKSCHCWNSLELCHDLANIRDIYEDSNEVVYAITDVTLRQLFGVLQGTLESSEMLDICLPGNYSFWTVSNTYTRSFAIVTDHAAAANTSQPQREGKIQLAPS